MFIVGYTMVFINLKNIIKWKKKHGLLFILGIVQNIG